MRLKENQRSVGSWKLDNEAFQGESWQLYQMLVISRVRQRLRISCWASARW